MQMPYAGERPGTVYERYSDGSLYDRLRGCLKHRPPHKYMLEMGYRYISQGVHKYDEYDQNIADLQRVPKGARFFIS